jgi:class 3 adenylate cyclase/pSer/pThr/pTyr-binding forkhead associated (FHA) protein
MIISYSLPLQAPQQFETESNSIIFGRNPSPDQHVDIDLVEDDFISHIHACLTFENNEYWIEDLGSANGTWVNEVEIKTETRLNPGDKVKVGWTIIEVQMEPPASTPDPSPVSDSPTILKDQIEPEDLIDQIEPADLMDQIEPQEPVSAPGPSKDSPTITRKHVEPAPPDDDPGHDTDADVLIAELVEPKVALSDEGTALESATSVTNRAGSMPPVAEPNPVPASEGTIVDLANITTRPHAISGHGTVDEILDQSRRQLTAFNDLCHMLSAADTLDSLVQILVKYLQRAIPNAQRGAVLLPDERGELLLKAHWPQGEHSISMTWIKRAYDRREPFIWSAAAESHTGNDTPESALYYSVQSSIYVPLLLGEQVLGVMYVDNDLTHEAFSGTDLELMRAIANQVAMFVRDHILRKDLKREEELRSHLSRQLSPKIADRICAKDSCLRTGGERVDPVTILVSDVRSFTALSAEMEPDEVVRMLNEMFDAFVPIVFEHDGVVDKYVGDSVLAVFGSPEKDDNQCEKAVKAALEMQRAVRKLGEGRKVRRLPVFDVGISVHTGAVIHGFIGSTERLEYTVIGDTVNRASRYCDGAAAGEVVISQTVYERVYNFVNVEPKVIRTKHPEIEPDLKAFVVKDLKR